MRCRQLCEDVLDRPDILADERGATTAVRMRNKEWLREELAATFATQPRQHWVDACAAVNVPVAPVNSYADLADDPHLRENGYIVDVEHEDWGTLTMPGFPTRFSETPVNNQLQGPELGEGTAHYLREVCGYSEGEVREIVQSGAVGEALAAKL